MKIDLSVWFGKVAKSTVFLAGVLTLVACVAPAPSDSGSTEAAMPSGKDLVAETQQMLADKNYDPGPIDGIMGKKTASALKAYQSDNELPPTGTIDKATYVSLKAQTPSLAGMLGSQFVDALLAEAGIKSPTKSGSSAKTSNDSSSGSVAEQEAAKRKELSRNHANVNFQVSCPDLYIPEVYEKKYRNMIPVYAMAVLNNSDQRYSVQYDLVYEKRADDVPSKNVFGTTVHGRPGYTETLAETKSFTVRPGALTEFLLIERNQNGGSYIAGIKEVDVFKCTSP